MKANEKKTPSMTAQEYMDTLEMATELQCLLPVRNTWESMGVIMEGWCRGQNPRDIIELAKCGRNELQIMGSIYSGTVQQDLQEAREARAAKQMIRALQAAGTTTEEMAEGITEESAEKFGAYVSETVETSSNLRGSAQYRKIIAGVLAKRALLQIAQMDESEQEGRK